MKVTGYNVLEWNSSNEISNRWTYCDYDSATGSYTLTFVTDEQTQESRKRFGFQEFIAETGRNAVAEESGRGHTEGEMCKHQYYDKWKEIYNVYCGAVK